MKARTVVLLAGLAVAAHLADVATGAKPRQDRVRIGVWSQNIGSQRAEVHAHVNAIGTHAGHSPDDYASARPAAVRTVEPVPRSRAQSDPPPAWPTLRSDSPLLRNPTPYGRGSFWYPVGPGRACSYIPDGTSPCVRIVGPGAAGSGARSIEKRFVRPSKTSSEGCCARDSSRRAAQSACSKASRARARFLGSDGMGSE